MTIIPYEDKYRDDMIFMVLQAKDALGRVPTLNEDLLRVSEHYKGRFWLALSGEDRVIGCVGYEPFAEDAAKLHRLYVKASLKRQGIGSALLETAERHMKQDGYKYSVVHLGGKEYFESRQFYPKHGYTEYAPDYMGREL